jgi:hypothetical protein
MLQLARGDWLQYLGLDDYLAGEFALQMEFIAGNPVARVVFRGDERGHPFEVAEFKILLELPG